MPYKYHWIDAEQSIIQIDIEGKVTWEQWRDVINKIVAELNKVPYRVDIIINDTVGMPKGNPIKHMNATQKQLDDCPNMGLIVTVSPKEVSAFVEMIVKIVKDTSLAPTRPKGNFVTSFDEALKMIAESRNKNDASNK